MMFPGSAEADVGKADGSPSKECSETRKSEEPVKDNGTLGIQVDVGEETEGDDGNGRKERTSGLVDVFEELGGVTLLCEGGQSSGSTVHAGKTDGDDRNENDNVQEAVESVETGILGSNDERAGSDINEGVGAQQPLVIRADHEADEEQAENVKAGTPLAR